MRYKQYKAMQDIREIEFRDSESKETPRYISRFEPLLYVPAFTQKDFHYIVHTGLPTQGTSTEDLGNTNLEYITPLSTNNKLYTRGKAQQLSPHTRGIRHLAKPITITSTQEG